MSGLEREVVPVGVAEPRDPRTAGRAPDSAVILGHARVAVECDAGLDEPINFAVQVFNDPSKDRVGRRANLIHCCDPKLAHWCLVYQGIGARVDQLEAEHTRIEQLSRVQVAHPYESHLLGLTEHLNSSSPREWPAQCCCATIAPRGWKGQSHGAGCSHPMGECVGEG